MISDYAEILSGQVREYINAADEINRYVLPGERFRERMGEGRFSQRMNQEPLRCSQGLLMGLSFSTSVIEWSGKRG